MGILQHVGHDRWAAMFGAATQPPQLHLTFTPTLSPETLTITRCTVSFPTYISWGDGETTALAAGSTAAINHTYATAGTYPVTVHNAAVITQLALNSAKIGRLNTAELRDSAITYFYIASITGSIVNSADMAGWAPTYWNAGNFAAGTFTINSADMVAWMPTYWYIYNVPGAGTYIIDSTDMAAWTPLNWHIYSMPAGTYSINSADMAGWAPTSWQLYSMPAGAYTIDTTDMAAWNPQTWYCHTNPAGGSSYTFGAAIMRNWANVRDIRCQGLALNQATVDAILFDIYAGRMGYTYATPALNCAGTNSTPSGVYADEDPPVTGKGAAFELVNDPELEGFRKWAITFTP